MKLRSIMSMIILGFVVLPLAAQQPAAEKAKAPEANAAKTEAAAAPTAEQMLSRLRYQWEALLVASIENAKEHGQTALQYGKGIGKIYSPSWGKELKAQRFGRGMRDNLNLMSWTAELTEDTPDSIVMRFKGPDVARLEKRYGAGAATAAQMIDALNGIGEVITTEHGLSYEHHRDGEWEVVHVALKK